jgi:hypothetical protein
VNVNVARVSDLVAIQFEYLRFLRRLARIVSRLVLAMRNEDGGAEVLFRK